MFALLGFVGIAFYNVALNSGEIHIPSAEASFLIASAPIFMALEAMPFLGERLRMWGWIGIALSCGGIALITLSQSTGFHIDIWAILIFGGRRWCIRPCRSHSCQYTGTKNHALEGLLKTFHHCGEAC